MNQVAVFYGNTTVYFGSVLIAFAVLSAFIFTPALYIPRHRYSAAVWLFTPLATVFSIIACRFIHWYCNPEQYSDLATAMTDYSRGDYCISGILIATWFTAMLLWCLQLTGSRFDLLDAAAPGLAFVIAIIRLTHIFSDKCLGKMIFTDSMFFGLPLSYPVTGSDGSTEYRFASFFISFLLLLTLSVLLVLFYIHKKDRYFDAAASGSSYDSISRKARHSDGHTYRMFLLFFSAEEVFIDSTRYDASHLFFHSEKLANLNKGTSFMGLSQFVSALILIYLFVYYLVSSLKTTKKAGLSKKYLFLTVPLFVFGLAVAGGCEYLVQRFTGMWTYIYPGQIAGLALMCASVILMYRRTVTDKVPEDIYALKRLNESENTV